MLAVAGAAAYWASMATRFWVVASVVSFLLALGPQTLLGEMLFSAPGFRLFTKTSRYVLTFHFALSVLCGLGAAAVLARKPVGPGKIAWGLLPTALAILSYPLVVEKAKSAGVVLPASWSNVAIQMPAAIAVLSATALLFATRVSGKVAAAALLGAAVIAGCAYFGLNAPWLIASGAAAAAIDPPPVVRALKAIPGAGDGRVLAADGWLGPHGIGPNQNMLFGLRSVSGYGPLVSKDYVDFALVTNAGWINPAIFHPDSLSLDLLATKWVFPHSTKGKTVERQGLSFSALPLAQSIGGSCAGVPLSREVSFRLPKRTRVKEIALVTTMGCARDVPQGTIVAHAVLDGGDGGEALRVPIVAGVHTAEWTAACPMPSDTVRHQPAGVFDSTALPHAPGCQGHHYIARLPASNRDSATLRIEWNAIDGTYPKTILTVQHVTVIGTEAGTTLPLEVFDTLSPDGERWRLHRLASGHDAFENLRAMPWAWLVRVAVRLPDNAKAIEAVRSGWLPDGRRIDPAREAVTVEPVDLPGPGAGATAGPSEATVERWESGRIEVAVNTADRAILVLSQRAFPGWTADVDGQPARILRVNGILQGVEVPPGRHRLTLAFAPPYLPWLSLIAGLALVVALALIRYGRAPRAPEPRNHGN